MTFDLQQVRREVAQVRGEIVATKVWLHEKTGGACWVESVAINEADGTVMVVYRHVESGICWVRPAAEFVDGRFTPLRNDHYAALKGGE